ncbi:Allantoin permease, partial [Colletotrichum gloeosporioides]
NPYNVTSETAPERSSGQHVLSNYDLDPTEPAHRNWTWLHYTSFWLASSFATGNWTTGSAMIALGMPCYAAWLAVVVSRIIGAVLLVANVMHGCPACFAVLIWAIVLNGGSNGPSFQVSPKISNSGYYGWLWPSDQSWSQLLTYPIFSALPALFGILVANATSNVWGKVYWNLWDVLSEALDYYQMSAASRGLVFLASFSFAVAILGTNVAANSLPFGSDIAGLFPRWINIRRGQSLLTFLSGYSILMGPFAAICIVDYFFVANGNFSITELYVGNESYRYWYYKGWNIRAIAAWILGVALPFPGFVGTFVLL